MIFGNNQKMGMSCHLEGMEDPELTIQVRLMAEAGVKWVRYDFSMGRTEAVQGVLDFSDYDPQVDLLAEYDIQVIAILDQYVTPGWANGGHTFMYPALPQYYGPWCQAVAEHFGNKISIYELGNEPNLSNFWLPSQNVAAYTAFMIAGYQGVKAGKPDAIVLSAGFNADVGVSPSAHTFLSGVYSNGGKGYFDALSIHPYTRPDAPGFSAIDPCITVMESNGDFNMPIYVTEVGWSTADDDQGISEALQAQYVRDLYALAMSGGAYDYVEKVFWYDFKNDGISPTNLEHNFGLIRHGSDVYPYMPKPSFFAYQGVAGMRKFMPTFIHTASPTIYLFVDSFNRDNGSLGDLDSGQTWNAPNYTISSLAAKNAPTLGSEMVTNGTFTTDTTGWTAVDATLDSVGGMLRVTNVGANKGYAYQHITTIVGEWYKLNLTFINGTTFTNINIGTAPGDGSYYTAQISSGSITGRDVYFQATTTDTYINLGTNVATHSLTVFYDSITLKQLTLSTIIATVESEISDIDMSIKNNPVQYSFNGLILNIDDASNPQNFVLVLEGNQTGKIYLIKCVAGSYTIVSTFTITNVSGSKLQIRKTGNSYQVYYNGSAVGLPQTISDVEIVDNTIHGMWLPDNQANFENFLLNPA